MRAQGVHSVGFVPRASDPAERYRAALMCLDAGDEVTARRAVEEGLAHAWAPAAAPVRTCLDDLGAQLDGEAALRRFAARTPGPRGWLARPDELARHVLALGRAHLVEAVVEEIALVLPPPVMVRLVGRLASAGTPGTHDLLAAVAAVVPGAPGAAARDAWHGARPHSPPARALAFPRLAAAWSCGAHGARGQDQVILAVARDGGRVAPLVALVEHHDLGALLRDAFFLPDMVPGRLEREVLHPLAAAGMPAVPMDVADALDLACAALSGSQAVGHRIPSEAHQSVICRIRRLQAACAGSHGHAPPGGPSGVG